MKMKKRVIYQAYPSMYQSVLDQYFIIGLSLVPCYVYIYYVPSLSCVGALHTASLLDIAN